MVRSWTKIENNEIAPETSFSRKMHFEAIDDTRAPAQWQALWPRYKAAVTVFVHDTMSELIYRQYLFYLRIMYNIILCIVY